jgi:hypothetical protein
MPIPVLRARVAVVGLALAATMSLVSMAEAKTVPAELRVVDSDGTVLAEQTQYTSKEDVKVKTDKRADCFGPDTGGSGDKAAVPGGTAFAQLVDGGRVDRDLRPLSVSDHFDFGLALCGIGKAISPQTGFFYLKSDHVASQVAGDQTKVGKGDEILWFLIEDFNDPIPDELVLSAPSKAQSGADVTVKVTAYADDGSKSPAEGVTVTGADAPTDASGKTTVPADAELITLTATRDGAIPSNDEVICTVKPADCPPGYESTIAGTGGDDKIKTGKAAERVLAGGGDDRITAKGGGKAPDLVKCGGGDDKVTGYGKSGATKFAGCEKVR